LLGFNAADPIAGLIISIASLAVHRTAVIEVLRVDVEPDSRAAAQAHTTIGRGCPSKVMSVRPSVDA
jgi:hypothetical protein